MRIFRRLLSKTLQRYENKSKSQPTYLVLHSLPSCLRLCKDTKIKANHNRGRVGTKRSALSKTLQRYENKSKSQPKRSACRSDGGCLRLCKDTKIKANHNEKDNIAERPQLSKTLQRYENKSKSQQMIGRVNGVNSCLRLCKDTKIKANHNIKALYQDGHRVV